MESSDLVHTGQNGTRKFLQVGSQKSVPDPERPVRFDMFLAALKKGRSQKLRRT